MQATPQKQYHIETDYLGVLTGPRTRVISLFVFFAAVACTYLQWYPHNYRLFKAEDSGLFLHVGQRLTDGDVLYRDISDIKPPLIYWLNEVGLILGHGSPAGVFLFCLAAGILTFAILYWGLKQYVRWELVIIAGCLSQLAFLKCALHPNYTEAYSMPLVALSAVLFMRELLDRRIVAWHPVAQGAIAALLFCLRPNNTGIAISYLLYLVVDSRSGRRFRRLCLFAAAASTIYALVLLPLALQRTLRDYFTAAFRLAGPYSEGNPVMTHFRALWHGVHLFGDSPLLYFSVGSGATAVLSHRDSPRTRVLLWLAVWLALEMVMSSISGYHWAHYYLLWILPMALLMMLAGSVVFSRGFDPILAVVLVLGLELVILNEAATNAYRAWSYPRTEDPALILARTYAQPGDRITTWGHFDHSLWFELAHRPGTRWFHEGVYTNRKIYEALVPTFLSDLEQNRTRVVIERRSAVPLFAPAKPDEPLNDAFPAEYFQGWDDASIAKRKAALAQQYDPLIEQSGIVVYLRRK